MTAVVALDITAELDALTVPGTRQVIRDDGACTWATVASLLDQLAEAVGTPSGAAGAFRAASKPPLYLDALALLTEIDATVCDHDRSTRGQRVRAWALNAPRVEAYDTVTRWAASARALLDPKPRYRMRGQACPACGATRVFDSRDDAAGEVHFRPALEIDTDRGVCRCTAPRCDAEWAPDRWEHLARVLEQQQAEREANR